MKHLKTLEQFINESSAEALLEKLIIFNNQPYQPFGNIVIMAGGAGSGKGFVKNTLIGLDGWTFDVDELKTLAMKSSKFAAKAKEETGVDIKKMDLREPEDVATLHNVVNDIYGVDEKKMQRMYASVLAAAPDRKPNLIFDVTLKNLKKLSEISMFGKDLGYSPEHIHIVWVINHIEIAKMQNRKRDRVVPEEILFTTHEGASATMLTLMNMGEDITRYLNGDIVFAFNQAGVDTTIVKKEIPNNIMSGTQLFGDKSSSTMYVKDAFYVYVKRAGKPVVPPQQLADNIISKINAYTPIKWD